METVIAALGSALITGVVTLTVCLINNTVERKKLDQAHKESTELILYRIDELQKHVEKHNKVVERTYALESRADVIEEKIKVANNRIADLEDDQKKGAVV